MGGLVRAVLLIGCVAVGPSVVAAVGPVQAQALFYNMHGVQGSILFEQDSPQDNTRVTVRLSGLEDGPLPWHIHEHPLADTLSPNCSNAGDHFEVSAKGPSRWDMGVMNSTHGAFYEHESVLSTGINVSLSGLHSIVGHSVVVHHARGSALHATPWVCANIEYVDPPIAAWAVFNMHGVGGSIQLSQGTNGDSATQIKIDLTGLKDGPNPWHVHENPVGGSCDRASTGDHFGPEAVWNLTAKHGSLNGAVVNQQYTELTVGGLPLFGPGSVVGKSIVIHKKNQDPWVCATIKRRPVCHDDLSWIDDDGTNCANIVDKPLKCLGNHNSKERMDHCPRACGYCPDEVDVPNYTLKNDSISRPALISAGRDNWFHFTGEKGKTYEIVVTVIPGASNLQDSVLELHSRDPEDVVIQRNDDANTNPGNQKGRGDRGSKIVWPCNETGEYWVRVRAFGPRDNGFYMIRLTTVEQADSCTDGKQNVGEEGVDCGGDCQPCHINIILGFTQSLSNSGDLTRVDEDSNGVPDFFENLEKDVKSALDDTAWNRVEVKYVQFTPNGLLASMFLEAPSGFYQFIDPELVVQKLTTKINDGHSALSIKQPDLNSVSRGVLCPSLAAATGNATNDPYLCWYGSCNTDITNAVMCNCDSGYTGPHCHVPPAPEHGTVQTLPPPAGTHRWIFPALGCVVLGFVVLACWQRNRIERRKYNESVFEMLQAPDTFSGPNTNFIKTTSAGLLVTASPGRNGQTPQQLDYDTSTTYTPDKNYVTGGF